MMISLLIGASLSAAAAPLSLAQAQEPAAPPRIQVRVPPEAPPDPQPVTDIVVLDPVGIAVRGPLQTDPLASLIALGVAPQPQAGTVLAIGDGRTRTWRALSSPEGNYSDPALRGGWAFVRLQRERPGVYLLDAAGHAATWVDGTPRAGDPYGLGIVRTPIVIPPGGTNVLFKGARGELRASVTTPPAPIFLDTRDLTVPDLVRGQAVDSVASLLVVNATAGVQANLVIRLGLEYEDGQEMLSVQRIPDLVPLETRKQTVALPLRMQVPEGQNEVKVVATLSQIDPNDETRQAVLHQVAFQLRVRSPEQTQVHAFISSIDESAQIYALVPRAAGFDPSTPPGMVLSLHGAGVEARGQAENLSPRPFGFSVAPTNRRTYGFDWENWGRADALEVLYAAGARLGIDPTRITLSGHSMGGHGTWLLGAQFPGLFAAIAPSAGWRDFWTYAGAWTPGSNDPVGELLARAGNISRLELVQSNLEPRGVYILHGDADDNVPVEEARAMRASLGTFHTDFAYHEEPGAGHWWGSQCVDREELYAFLQGRRLPGDSEVLDINFTTVNPGVSSRLHWITLEAQHHPLLPSSVDARLKPEGRRFIIKTQNVSRLRIDLSQLGFAQAGKPPVLPAEKDFVVMIDSQQVDITWPPGARDLRLLRRQPGSEWEAMGPVNPRWKSPQRAGPFKEAFKNLMTFVYATGGTPEENAWSLAKARYDLEDWRYRANGSALLLSDQRYLQMTPAARAERNLILYGNADANLAWSALPKDCPIEVRRGLVRVGERRMQRNDLGCIFTFPLDDGPSVSAAVICGSGPIGERLTEPLPIFRSGAAFPDWTVLTPEIFKQGAGGLLGTGFFGYDWTVERGDRAWADAE